MIWRKGMNRRTEARQNGCFRKMDDPLVHTTPNYYLPKMDVFPTNFLQIILAAKELVRHLILSPQTTATTCAFASVCVFFYGRPLWAWTDLVWFCGECRRRRRRATSWSRPSPSWGRGGRSSQMLSGIHIHYTPINSFMYVCYFTVWSRSSSFALSSLSLLILVFAFKEI